MLEIKNLSKYFESVQVVQDFSLSLQPRTITGLIGPNGAGKTTLFNIVTGFLLPDNGEVRYKNISLIDLSPWKIACIGISRTFQNIRLFKRLSVLENVLLGRKNRSGEQLLNALLTYSDMSSEEKVHIKKAKSLLEFVGLADHEKDLAENLSYGQQKLLTIACCLSSEPELLLLDEPVSGIQPAMIEKIHSLLKELVEKRCMTVFLIEHDIGFVLKISDYVVVMDEGLKILAGSPYVIKNNPEFLEAYLT